MPQKSSYRIAAILLFLLASANAVSYFYDLDFLRPRVEKVISDATGFPVTFAPGVHLGVIRSRPSLEFSGMKVTDRAAGIDVQAQAVEASIPLTPAADFYRLRLQGLTVNGVTAGDYRLPLQILPDGILIKRLKGQRAGAGIEGRFSYTGNTLETAATVTGVDYTEIAQGLSGGDAALYVHIRSEGDSARTLRAGASGRVLFHGGRGTMEGQAVNFWAGNLMSAMLSDVGGKKNTAVNCILADFDIKNGLARSRALVIDTEKVFIFGKGNIDLSSGRIDMVFTPKPKSGTFLSLATPVRLRGTLDKPVATPEGKEALKKIGGLLLGAINPAAALLPMFEDGSKIKKPCETYLSKNPWVDE